MINALILQLVTAVQKDTRKKQMIPVVPVGQIPMQNQETMFVLLAQQELFLEQQQVSAMIVSLDVISALMIPLAKLVLQDIKRSLLITLARYVQQ